MFAHASFGNVLQPQLNSKDSTQATSQVPAGQPQPLAALARSAAPTGHSAAIPALRTMMRAFLLAAAATVATALTPAQADLLLSLQGRLQELNVRRSLAASPPFSPLPPLTYWPCA